MATVIGLTAERMMEIEGASVIDGEVVAGNLILTKHDGTQINAGPVTGSQGPAGPQGPSGVNAIPGEVKLWPSSVLPDLEDYGKWVWADGAVYPVANHPLAAANIGTQWRTFDGASDPGAPNFRVPDLRGLVAAGLDAMPGGARANRMTRAAAIVVAAKSGKETHQLVIGEISAHTHTSGGGHLHTPHNPASGNSFAVTKDVGEGVIGYVNAWVPGNEPYALYKEGGTAYADVPSFNAAGGNGAHENIQPTVFVPYIVCLDE